MLKYYEREFKKRSDQSPLWFLSPKTSLIRHNRNALRKLVKNDASASSELEIQDADLEVAMGKYYREQLADIRRGLVPWFVNPKALIAKMNRNSFKSGRKKEKLN